MTISYLDTSAAMKLVLDEPQSEALTAELAGHVDRRLISSWLLHAEMHCAAGRHPRAVDLEAVGTVLDAVSLIDLTRGDLLAAGTNAPLRANGAIHLAVALRVGADEIVTYDGELIERATAAGVPVLSPGTTLASRPAKRSERFTIRRANDARLRPGVDLDDSAGLRDLMDGLR